MEQKRSVHWPSPAISRVLICWLVYWGLPGGSDSKESACHARDLCLILRLGRFPGEGNSYPLQYSCLENSMDSGAWRARVHGVAESRTRLSAFTFTLLGPRDRRAGTCFKGWIPMPLPPGCLGTLPHYQLEGTLLAHNSEVRTFSDQISAREQHLLFQQSSCTPTVGWDTVWGIGETVVKTNGWFPAFIEVGDRS